MTEIERAIEELKDIRDQLDEIYDAPYIDPLHPAYYKALADVLGMLNKRIRELKAEQLKEDRERLIDQKGSDYSGIAKMDAEIEELKNDVLPKWRPVTVTDSKSWDRWRYYCPVCGDWQTYGEPKYCPNCGARVGKEDEQNE